MIKAWLMFAALSGLTSVALGAFGAHGLRGKLDQNLMHAFETGVLYQMTHTLALLLVAVMMMQWGSKTALNVSAGAFALGIVLFSGSLYGLALTGMKWLGPVTPMGGVAFLVGWLALVAAVWHYPGR